MSNPSRKRIVAWALSNPDQAKAHTMVKLALHFGMLTKTPCETCGDPRSVAHHDDYRKPLDVRWVCKSCHQQIHAKLDQHRKVFGA